MKRFIKTFIVFIYLILALFIQPNDVFACDYFGQNLTTQYHISTTKSENHFINNKNEEYYIFSKNNQTEISDPSNKNQNFSFGNFDKTNVNFILPNNSIVNNSTYPICISHNISPNLKNAIYTRAP